MVITVAEHSAQILAPAVLLAGQLPTALTKQAAIDQAIAIIAARTGRGTDEAFAQLRLLTRAQNITLVEVCRRMVDEAIAAADT